MIQQVLLPKVVRCVPCTFQKAANSCYASLQQDDHQQREAAPEACEESMLRKTISRHCSCSYAVIRHAQPLLQKHIQTSAVARQHAC
jgi:hypothetical protein